MINWKNVEKWRDELRSGKWNQAHGIMCDHGENSYCCLGVFQYAVQGRLEDDWQSNMDLDSSGVYALGCKFTVPRLLGIGVAFFNDSSFHADDGGNICSWESPLTFDEIADLLTICLIEKDYLT